MDIPLELTLCFKIIPMKGERQYINLKRESGVYIG